MTVKLYIAKHCATCLKVEKKLRNLLQDKNGIILQIEDIEKSSGKNIMIIPALFVNDELLFYGDIQSHVLLQRLDK